MFSLLYTVFKDVLKSFRYTEGEKKIDNKYLQQIKKKHEGNGEDFEFRWSNEDKIEARKPEEWKIYYEVDKANKIKFTLKNKSCQILVVRNRLRP